jgi:hypothetical protein
MDSGRNNIKVIGTSNYGFVVIFGVVSSPYLRRICVVPLTVCSPAKRPSKLIRLNKYPVNESAPPVIVLRHLLPFPAMQEWLNLARDDVWRLRKTRPLVSFLVGWLVGWLVGRSVGRSL